MIFGCFAVWATTVLKQIVSSARGFAVSNLIELSFWLGFWFIVTGLRTVLSTLRDIAVVQVSIGIDHGKTVGWNLCRDRRDATITMGTGQAYWC